MSRRTLTAKFTRLLESRGIAYELLPDKECWRFQQTWRETYSRAVYDATGKWTHLGFDWHAFSYGFTPALERDSARNEYRQVSVGTYLILPDKDEMPGLRCMNALPDLSRKGVDAYVCAPDMSWTMVFTHEDDDCGPYFSTVEMVGQQ